MILAIDTATQWLGLAMHDGRSIRAEIGWHCSRQHTVELAPTIEFLCQKTGTRLEELSAVAVTIGPGSYTGLRVGLAVAKGLALANNTPIIGVSTLDVVAHSFGPLPGKLLVAAEAGRSRVVWTTYYWQNGKGWISEKIPEIDAWESLLPQLHGRLTFAGEIDPVAIKLIKGSSNTYHIALPTYSARRAGNLAEMGWQRLRKRDTDDAAALAPVYLRDPAGKKLAQGDED